MLVSPDPALYSFINQGALTADGIDDVEEMKITDVCIGWQKLILKKSSKNQNIHMETNQHPNKCKKNK